MRLRRNETLLWLAFAVVCAFVAYEFVLTVRALHR